MYKNPVYVIFPLFVDNLWKTGNNTPVLSTYIHMNFSFFLFSRVENQKSRKNKRWTVHICYVNNNYIIHIYPQFIPVFPSVRGLFFRLF